MARRRKKNPVCTCEVCGEPLYDGDRAYGTTNGGIYEAYGGFSEDDCEPWLTTACEKCGNRISDIISYIRAHPDKLPAIIKAVKKAAEGD